MVGIFIVLAEKRLPLDVSSYHGSYFHTVTGKLLDILRPELSGFAEDRERKI